MKKFLYNILGLVAGWLIPADTTTGSTISGTPTRENTESNESLHLSRDVSKIVTEIKPDDFPLDTIIRNVRPAEKVHNTKVEYETVTYRERSTAVNGAMTNTAKTASYTITVDDATIFGVDDTIYIPTVTTYAVDGSSTFTAAGGKGVRLHVTAVPTSTTVTVQIINPDSTDTDAAAPDLADNTVIYRMGNAKTELDAQASVVTAIPGTDYNYTQIFMCQLEQSEVLAQHKSYSGYGYNDKRLQEIYNFRSSLEASFIGGKRASLTVGSDTHYEADGLREKIGQTLTFGSGSSAVDPSSDDVIDLLKNVFASNSGSYERWLFGGSGLIAGLQKINFNKDQGAGEVEIKWGVKVMKFESNFGVLYIKYSKMMDELGHTNDAFIVDFDHVFKHDLEPMKVEKLELYKSGTRRVQDAMRVVENTCLTVRYQDDVHAFWTPAT